MGPSPPPLSIFEHCPLLHRGRTQRNRNGQERVVIGPAPRFSGPSHFNPAGLMRSDPTRGRRTGEKNQWRRMPWAALRELATGSV